MQMSYNICPLIHLKHKIQTTHNLEQMKYLGTLLEGCLNCAGQRQELILIFVFLCLWITVNLPAQFKEMEKTLLKMGGLTNSSSLW